MLGLLMAFAKEVARLSFEPIIRSMWARFGASPMRLSATKNSIFAIIILSFISIIN
jgi:hypothetical protein